MATRGKAYTRIQLLFLHEQYQVLTVAQLQVAFNKRFHQDRTVKAIKSVLRVNRITCGNNMRKGYTGQLMTAKQCAWLERHYIDISVRCITQQFNWRYQTSITDKQMKTFISNRGFTSGRSGCFPKGNVPANKGITRPPGWSPGRMSETQFKPGHCQTEVKPIGHERTDKDGYILVKHPMINPHTGAWGYYVPKHKVIWEAANGRLPDNHVLTFIDDDRTNVVLDNLELISRGELARRNKMKYREAQPELRESIKALAKLQHYTGQRARRK